MSCKPKSSSKVKTSAQIHLNMVAVDGILLILMLVSVQWAHSKPMKVFLKPSPGGSSIPAVLQISSGGIRIVDDERRVEVGIPLEVLQCLTKID